MAPQARIQRIPSSAPLRPVPGSTSSRRSGSRTRTRRLQHPQTRAEAQGPRGEEWLPKLTTPRRRGHRVRSEAQPRNFQGRGRHLATPSSATPMGETRRSRGSRSFVDCAAGRFVQTVSPAAVLPSALSRQQEDFHASGCPRLRCAPATLSRGTCKSRFSVAMCFCEHWGVLCRLRRPHSPSSLVGCSRPL